MAKSRAKLDTFGQREEVLKRLETEPAGLVRERLHAVRLGLEGQVNLEEIAATAGRSRATIQTWFDLYRHGGVERLCRRSNAPTGRRSLLCPDREKELRNKLAKGGFRRMTDAGNWPASNANIKAHPEIVSSGWEGLVRD